jgi:hypothetical protein
MKRKTYLGTLVLAAAGATLLGLASARAQSAEDLDPQWCINRRNSILRNYQAIEEMTAKRQASFSRLTADQYAQATEDLITWHQKKMEEIFRQMRELGIQCRAMQIRPDPPGPGRVAPVPQPSKPREANQQPRPQQPYGNNGRVWTYPPYQSPGGGGTYDPRRAAESPTDPFSPNVRR